MARPGFFPLCQHWQHQARHALAHSLRIGWRDAARPLVADYVGKLADELRSPLTRARLNTELLPESVDVAA